MTEMMSSSIATYVSYTSSASKTSSVVVVAPVPTYASGNGTMTNGTSGSASASVHTPVPTYNSGAAAKAGSILLSVAIAGVAVFAL